MKNILLAGYYGFGNLGDEAILEMFLDIFENSSNINNVTVLSGNSEETKKRYNVDAIDRYDIFGVISNLKKSDALVFGGGSLLQDVTSKRSLFYYLSIISIAKIFRKKVVLLSQGIGPIVHKENYKKLSKVLRKVDIITVRDYRSVEILESMNIDKNKIRFSADPVININHNINNFSNSDKKKVCFSLRNWKDVNMIDYICSVVNKLYQNGIESTFICFHYNIDSLLLDELQKRIGDKAIFIKDRLTTEKALDIISESDVVVGVRLHALILSASVFVPFIALSYDPKIDEFLKCFDLKSFTNMDKMKTDNSDDLYREIIKKIENKEKEIKNLKKGVNELRRTLDVNIEIINDI